MSITQNNRQSRNFGPKGKKEAQHRINENITAQVVRVVGDGLEPQIVSLREALAIADEKGVDLVEISPQANPPVCKVMDYQKYLYEQKKKLKEIKANSAKTEVKEIRLSPQISDHDLEFKCNHAIRFLQDGYKVKIMMTFRGRSIIYKDNGELELLKFAERLQDYGKVDQMPVMTGRNMTIMMVPKSKK
ncbi:MAG: translation initiation factor IF-3 [Bacteroidales bacterium]|nr:translation initiation factor IF-3 [Bacteroidales bacterium]MDY6348718.1 translation initiation factor IF-3 [Bacteroidales bacterium]